MAPRTYRVAWEIDVEASSIEEAAQQAISIQRDPDSTATVFTVTWTGADEYGNACTGTSTIDLQSADQ